MVSRGQSQLLWSYSSTITNSILQLLAAVTITRFVAPAEYGLVALAILCCRFPSFLSQLGMGRAVVQRPDLSKENIQAAFTLSLGLGLAGCFIVAAASPLFAGFFHEPRLKPILLILSLNFVFQGATLVSGGLLRRALKMRELALLDTLSYLISTFGIGLPIAIKGYGAWAIVASTVSQSLATAILYFVAMPHTLRPALCRSNYEDILKFGGKATGTSMIEGLGASLDTLILGRLSTSEGVGLFNRTALLIQLPVQNVSNGLTQVLFTKLSRASAQGSAQARELLLKSQRIFLSVVFPLCAGASVAASSIVLAVYGSKWTSAIPVFAVLCVVTAADASHNLPAVQMEAQARFKHKVRIQALYMVCLAGGIYVSVPYGLVVVAITAATLQVFRSIAIHYYAARYLDSSFRSIMLTWAPGSVAAAAVAASVVLLLRVIPARGLIETILQLILCMVAGLIACLLVYAFLFRRSVYDPLMSIFGVCSADASGSKHRSDVLKPMKHQRSWRLP